LDQRRQRFLAAVLGDEGAELLIKTIDRAPVLEHAIVPRTILAWLQSASAFEGDVLEGIQMVFEKSDSGFTGSIAMGGESYEFEEVNVFHVAASVAAALGIRELESEGIRTLDLERIGKTIDLMSKAHRVNVELDLHKKSPPGKFHDLPEKLKEEGHSASSAFAIAWSQKGKEDAKKAEPDPSASCTACAEVKGHANHGGTEGKGWGKVHAWTPPKQKFGKDEPSAEDMEKAIGDSTPPAAPTAAKPAKAGAPKTASTGAPKMSASKGTSVATMSLTRSEAGSPCLACGGRQLVDDKFVGCLCFEPFAKAVRVTSATDSGFVLELDRRVLDQDDVDALTDAFKATGVTDGE